jgi:hypothetical protein
VFYCDEIDAEPNVQKKYYAIELMFWNGQLILKEKKNCNKTILLPIYTILYYCLNCLNSFELEDKTVFRYRIWAENFKRQFAQSNFLAIFQISFQFNYIPFENTALI